MDTQCHCIDAHLAVGLCGQLLTSSGVRLALQSTHTDRVTKQARKFGMASMHNQACMSWANLYRSSESINTNTWQVVEAPSPGRVLHQAHRAVVVRNNLGAEAVVYAGLPGEIFHAGSPMAPRTPLRTIMPPLPWSHDIGSGSSGSCRLLAASSTASGLPVPQALDDAQIHHERQVGDVCINHPVYLLRRREARQLAGGGGRWEASRDEPFP
jgi:hypothetical protein